MTIELLGYDVVIKCICMLFSDVYDHYILMQNRRTDIVVHVLIENKFRISIKIFNLKNLAFSIACIHKMCSPL